MAARRGPKKIMDLPIRSEPDLSPDAMIVRGGEMLPKDLRHAAVNTLEKYGVLGISIFAGEFENIVELCQATPRNNIIPFSAIHHCRVKDLDQRLYQLLPTFIAPHFTLILKSVEDIHLERFKRRFTREVNPLGKH